MNRLKQLTSTILFGLIFLAAFSISSYAQVCLPVTQPDANTFKRFEGVQIWASVRDRVFFTAREDSWDAWIIDSEGRFKKIDGVTGPPLSVTALNDWFLFRTTQGTWVVTSDDRATKLDYPKTITGFSADDWILARSKEDELSIITINGSSAVEKRPELMDFLRALNAPRARATINNQLFFIGEETWIANKNGEITRVKGYQGTPSGHEAINKTLYLGTTKGLWTISSDGRITELEAFKNVSVRAVHSVGNHLLVTTDDEAFILTTENQVNKIEGIASRVRVDGTPGYLVLLSEEGLWLLNEAGMLTKVKLAVPAEIDQPPYATGLGNQILINIEDDLWRVDKDGTAISVTGISGEVNYFETFGSQAFAGTADGLWLIDQLGQPRKLDCYKDVSDSYEGVNVAVAGKHAYLYSDNSLFQYDSTIRIDAKLAPRGWWAKAIDFILPANWLPLGKVEVDVSYSGEINRNPHFRHTPREFRLAKADGDSTPTDDKFSTQDQFTYDISWGTNEVRFWVKDKWGNVVEQKQVYRGVPSQYFFAAFPFLLSAIFVLGSFVLAPRVDLCHSVIMNHWLRNYFSLGSIPLLLSSVPSLRRHILLRYSKGLTGNKDVMEWKERFVYPSEDFHPDHFGRRIENEKKLLLTGQSGIGKTSFFKHLTAYYAAQRKPALAKRVFPVYVSLTNYGEKKSLEDLVYDQLFSYGGITDKELAPMFLEQGGLLIFLDGVNEIQTVAGRQSLAAFVEKFWMSSYICLSSQQSYPEIDNLPKVEMQLLPRAKIDEFVIRRSDDKEKAAKIVESFTEEQYQLYRVPRDLEFGVQILNAGAKELPKSRTELYRTVFKSIFEKWNANGNVDAAEVVCQRAYTMITERDLSFDVVDEPRFKQITVDLFSERFLMRRENSYTFRHDLIRSYLASEYFHPRWANLMSKGEKQIDSNWLEMLKFSCERIEDSNEVKSLVYDVMEQSLRKDLVKNLFDWLRVNHPQKCEPWKEDFYREYGKLDFK